MNMILMMKSLFLMLELRDYRKKMSKLLISLST
jgi:hypothetical protein